MHGIITYLSSISPFSMNEYCTARTHEIRSIERNNVFFSRRLPSLVTVTLPRIHFLGNLYKTYRTQFLTKKGKESRIVEVRRRKKSRFLFFDYWGKKGNRPSSLFIVRLEFDRNSFGGWRGPPVSPGQPRSVSFASPRSISLLQSSCWRSGESSFRKYEALFFFPSFISFFTSLFFPAWIWLFEKSVLIIQSNRSRQRKGGRRRRFLGSTSYNCRGNCKMLSRKRQPQIHPFKHVRTRLRHYFPFARYSEVSI